jgi:hypothetical protein
LKVVNGVERIEVYPADSPLFHDKALVVFVFDNDPFEIDLTEAEATNTEPTEFKLSEKVGLPVRLGEESKRMVAGKRVIDVVPDIQTPERELMAKRRRFMALIGRVPTGTDASAPLAPLTLAALATPDAVPMEVEVI